MRNAGNTGGPTAFRRFADAWIGGGWHTMLAAGGLAADAALRFRFPTREAVAFVALNGGGALVLYGGRYALRMMSGGDGDRERALRGIPVFALFSCFVGTALALYGALTLPVIFSFWEAGCGFVALAYCYPVAGRAWREYGFVKPFLLALCWAAVTSGPPGPSGYATLVAARIVWLTGLALAFDAKDIGKDRAHGVFTPAVRWGERVLWPVVTVLLVAGLFGKLVIVPPAWRSPTFAAWIVSFLMLAKIRKSRSTRDWVVWGDGMMIVYALLPLLAFLLW